MNLKKITFETDVLNNMFKQNDGTIALLPHEEYDGFYIARIRRKS